MDSERQPRQSVEIIKTSPEQGRQADPLFLPGALLAGIAIDLARCPA